MKIIKLIFLLVVCHTVHSQTIINGTVKSAMNSIVSASIVLNDSISKTIIGYTYSNDDGTYTLTTSKKGKFSISFSSLGYKTKTISFEINNQKDLKIDAVLEEQAFEINEIIIQSEKDIKVKKDTITFKTKFFTNAT